MYFLEIRPYWPLVIVLWCKILLIWSARHKITFTLFTCVPVLSGMTWCRTDPAWLEIWPVSVRNVTNFEMKLWPIISGLNTSFSLVEWDETDFPKFSKNLNTVKVFWKNLLNGDRYYFGCDEIIFSKQATRPFGILTPIIKSSH